MSDSHALPVVVLVAIVAFSWLLVAVLRLPFERHESRKREARGGREDRLQELRTDWAAKLKMHCAAIAKFRREIPSSKHLDDVIFRARDTWNLEDRAFQREIALLESDRLSGWAWTRTALLRLLC